jgi:hypothetical protein
MMTKTWLNARQQNVYPLGMDAAALQPGAAGTVSRGRNATVIRPPQGDGPPEPPPPGEGAAAPKKSNWKPAESGSISRRIDDARALIPYIFGAFKQPNRHGLRLGLPMLQYCSPQIDLRTGRWTYHAKEALDLIAGILHVSEKIPLSALLLMNHRTEEAAGKKFAISSVLKSIDDIEAKIVNTLKTEKGSISKNYFLIRKLVLKGMSEQLSRFKSEKEPAEEAGNAATTAAWNEITQAIRVALTEENAKEKNASESLNLKGAFGYDNSAFGGISLVDDILSTLRDHSETENAKKLKDAYKKIGDQETEKLNSIIFTIECIRKVYTKTMDGFEKSEDLLEEFKMALMKSEHEGANHYESKAQLTAIEHYLAHFLAERVELLYCNIYTFFSAVIGKNHEAIHKLTLDLVKSTVLIAFVPVLELQFSKGWLLDEFYRTNTEKTGDVMNKNLLFQLNAHKGPFHDSHLRALFQLKVSAYESSSMEKMTMYKDIIESLEDLYGIESEKRKKFKLDKIYSRSHLTAVQSHVSPMSLITDQIKSILASAGSSQSFTIPNTPAVDPIKDHMFAVIQQKVTTSSDRRFSFNILSHAIIVDQRLNPYFAACYMIEDRGSFKDASWPASCFFKHSHSPYSTFAAQNDGSDKPDPFEGVWKAIPIDMTGTNGASAKSANPLVAKLALRNVDVISSFTGSKTPTQANSSKKKKNKAKNKTAPPKTANHPGSAIKKKAQQKKKKEDGKKPAKATTLK